MTVLLAACGEGGEAPVQPQRISLEDARAKVAEPLLSPDTEGARWSVTDGGQAIDFAREGSAPWLSLACDLREAPATLTVIRHAAARPGQKALFPVLGNGTISRFKVDAALHAGEWRWQGALPASDPQFDVFTGPREIEATLPGGGTLLIEGSRIPGEFVNWCRAGGRVLRAEAAEEAEAAGEVEPAPPESSSHRHCEERSDEAIQGGSARRPGLLRYARNDEIWVQLRSASSVSMPGVSTCGSTSASLPGAYHR